jgi:serine O-acetyltransferase
MHTSFSLIKCLRADIQRAYKLSHEPYSQIPYGVALWIGILSPRVIPVALCRLAYFFAKVHLSPLAKLISTLNFVLFGIEISPRCQIGKGLFLPHTQGTVIGAFCIGENVTIFQGVTLGARELDFSFQESSRPSVGDNVTIGAGAKVLGGLIVGSGSRIGANAVVLKSIPANVAAAGVPARITKSLD